MSAKVYVRQFLGVMLASGLVTLASGAPPSQLQPLASTTAPIMRPLIGQALRTWTDANRVRQVSAVLLAADESRARLRRSDGTVVTATLDRFCTEDQHYIRVAPRHPSPVSTPPTPTNALEPVQKASNVKRSEPVNFVKNLVAMNFFEFKMPEFSPLRTADESVPQLHKPTIPRNMVYVRISRSFLNRFIVRDVDRRDAVANTILDRPVVGTARTQGRLELALKPSMQEALIELQFRGTSTSNTTAYDRRVQILSYAVTQFESRMPVGVDDHGVRLFPSHTIATTRSSTTGIATGLPRLRGQLAVRIAAPRVEASRNEVDRISSNIAAMRINGEFDRTLNHQIQELNREILAKVSQFQTDHSVPQMGFRFSTTSDALHIVVLRPVGGNQQIVAAPVATAGQPDIEVHVHTALVNRVLIDSELRSRLRPMLNLLPILRSAAMTRVTAEIGAKTLQYGARWSEDRNWLTLVWDADGQPDNPPRPVTTTSTSTRWPTSGEERS